MATIANAGRRSAEFLGEPDEKTSGPADVAEPIRVFVLDHFTADKLRAALAESGERLVDVVDDDADVIHPKRNEPTLQFVVLNDNDSIAPAHIVPSRTSIRDNTVGDR